VVGVFKSGMYEYDSSLVYLALTEAQRLFDTGDVSTGIGARRGLRQFRAWRRRSRSGSAAATGAGLERMNHALFAAIRLEKIAMFVILTLIVLVASLASSGR
jgi:lipoprotein-releasing system permease protein